MAAACWIWRARITKRITIDAGVSIHDWYGWGRNLMFNKYAAYHRLGRSSDEENEMKNP